MSRKTADQRDRFVDIDDPGTLTGLAPNTAISSIDCPLSVS